MLEGERDDLASKKAEAEGEADDFRRGLAECKERDVAATLAKKKQVDAANAKVAELEEKVAACEKGKD